MKPLATIIALFLAAPVTMAAISEHYANRIADSIWHAEGGTSAKVPYGILSVPVHGAKEARQVCLTTIRHAWNDWTRLPANTRGDFLIFLAEIYCPVEDDRNGFSNWIKNVRWFLRRNDLRQN